jgi:tetratricopeptide (TPR) repeat protein
MPHTSEKLQPRFRIWVGMLLAACLAVAGPGTSRAQDQKMPFSTLRDWQDYNNVGWVALDRGNLDRAAQAFRKAIELIRPYEAKERMLMARSNADFARVLFRQKRYDEAEPLARWALAVRESIPGERSQALTQNLLLLAQIHRAQRQNAAAQVLLERTVAVQEKAVGAGHSDLAATLEELADVQAEQGKLDEAATHYRRALAIREANHDANLKKAKDLELRAEMVREVGGVVATPRQVWNNPAIQAEKLETEARAARESSAESASSVAATQRHAAVLRRAGRNDEADSMEVRARAMRDAAETHAARAAPGRQ